MAFKDYYIKINGNNFTSPFPAKYKLYPKLVQDLDSGRTADGIMHRNILAHKPAKIELEFPPMTFEQFRTYCAAMDADVLSVEYYDISKDTYKTADMYHNDIVIEEVNTSTGTKYINRWAVNLIGY